MGLPKSVIAGVVGVAVVLGAVGCGVSASGGTDQADLEVGLSEQVAANNYGSTFTDVTCVQRSDNEYRCIGQYRASLAEVKAFAGADPSADYMTDGDWQVVIEQRSGPVTYDVIIDPTDGSYIFTPV